jgi:hypothetical protein
MKLKETVKRTVKKAMKRELMILMRGLAFWIAAICFAACSVKSPSRISSLDESAFLSPDSTYYPGAWWWWLRCKTTKEAITLDLEEMKAKKIQRLILSDFGHGGRVPFEYLELASPEWNEMVRHSIRECSRLGLDFGICTETSGAAAPWVAWEDGQQKLVFAEIRTEGPSRLKTQLPYPAKLRMDENGMPVCYSEITVQAMPDRDTVAKEDVRNITSFVNQDGELDWEVPAGKWKIVRSGYAPTFKKMREFIYQDHLRTDIYEDYYSRYFGNLLNGLNPDERKSVKLIESDSYEAGAPGWSRQFAEDFKRQRKYAPEPWLPVLSGQTVESREASERFLYDYRQTVSELIAEHYRCFQQLAHRDEMLSLLEASGPYQRCADALLCQKYADLPMGEFWAPSEFHSNMLKARFMDKEAVSAAHIYGKNVISAEAFTSIGPQWEESPCSLKSSADRAFCEGINQIYFHTFSHSPSLSAKPGYVYDAGSHINRNVTWWELSYDWIAFLTRCQYMLQQGLPVVDVCFYYGEGVRERKTYREETPLTGESYQYDYTNSDAILERMTVRDGKIYLPDGMSYHVLALPDEKQIPLEVLEKIRKLVYAGATVTGNKPEKSTGLYRFEENDCRVVEIADEMWGKEALAVIDRPYGRGKVVCNKSIGEILADRRVLPDMEYKSCRDSSEIDFVHRKDGDAEIYYLANLTEQSDYANVAFRVTGKTPQIWNPVDGSVADMPVYADDGERISMPVYFAPYGSLFVVFRAKEEKPHVTSVTISGEEIFPKLPAAIPETEYCTPLPDGKTVFRTEGDYELKYSDGEVKNIAIRPARSQNIDGAWDVSFSVEWGGPEHVRFDRLMSWTESEMDGIKYYSGTAVYTNTFTIDEKSITGNCIELDLGEMYDVAEVAVNGKNLGTCWTKPFRKDISQAVVPGENTIGIKIANLWPNRLTGDSFLPEEKRYTETNFHTFTFLDMNKKFGKDESLRPSGLLGPVRINICNFCYTFAQNLR